MKTITRRAAAPARAKAAPSPSNTAHVSIVGPSRRRKFTGPTPSEIMKTKAVHGFQTVRFSISCDERNQWFNAARKEDHVAFDWLQVIVRRALQRPKGQQAPPAELPSGDGNTMTFFLLDKEFDAADFKARECGMSLRQWLYSTFKAAVKGGAQ